MNQINLWGLIIWAFLILNLDNNRGKIIWPNKNHKEEAVPEELAVPSVMVIGFQLLDDRPPVEPDGAAPQGAQELEELLVIALSWVQIPFRCWMILEIGTIDSMTIWTTWMAR